MIEELKYIFIRKETFKLFDKFGYGPYKSMYLKYPIKKKSGKLRWLNPPVEPLKSAQEEFLHRIAPLIKPHPCAVGFQKGTSVIDGAEAHLGCEVLLTMDLKNFFNNIQQYKIKNACINLSDAVVRNKGFDRKIISKLSDLFVNLVEGPTGLSQGAPTSPALSNLCARFLDRDLKELADKYNLVYTRYADDLSFSSMDPKLDMGPIRDEVEEKIRFHNFTLNLNKTRIQRPHNRMTVTGIVVNEKLSVPKWKWRQFRAKLHNIIKDKKQLSPTEIKEIEGYAQWIHQLHKKRGETFLTQIGKIKSFQQ